MYIGSTSNRPKVRELKLVFNKVSLLNKAKSMQRSLNLVGLYLVIQREIDERVFRTLLGNGYRSIDLSEGQCTGK